jgi:polyisoprenyl-phosphate glycosyltransferase
VSPPSPPPQSPSQSAYYSIIIPIYNEEETIGELYRRLTAVLDRLDSSVEVILIDDGSKDRSLILMRELNNQDPRFCYLSLARNFGHQVAVTAGLQFSRGEAVIVMDADLQDPPEVILELIHRWKEGYEVVYAQRRSRQQEGWFKRLTAYVFYRMLSKLTNFEIPNDTGDFCLMDRKIVEILNQMPERNRYIRGLRAWIGFNQTAVLFDRDPRFAGSVKYTFKKSLSLAMNGILALSKVPLQIATYLGLGAAIVGVIMMILVLYWRLSNPFSPLIGVTMVTMALFFLGAVQLFCIGILGEYISRIHEEVKGRPMYTLKEVAGLAQFEALGVDRYAPRGYPLGSGPRR